MRRSPKTFMSIAAQLEPPLHLRRVPPAPPPRAHAPLSNAKRLRRLSAAQAAWSTLLGDGVALTLPQAAPASAPVSTLQVQLARADAMRWRHAAPWSQVHIHLAGRPMPMRLAPHEQWQELSLPSYGELPSELQHAVAAHITQPARLALGSALQQAGLLADGQAPAISVAHEQYGENASGLDEPALVLALHIEGHGGPMRAYIGIADGVQAPSGAMQRRSERTCLDHVPLALRLVLAHALLPGTAALARLLPGDMLLLDAPSAAEGQAAAWIAFTQQAIGRAVVKGWQLPPIGQPTATADPNATATVHFERWLDADERHAWRAQTQPGAQHSMDTTEDTPNNLAAALGDAVVSVEAVVDLPAARIPDLQSWATGTVLRTTLPIDGNAVRLRVAGQTVGRGRLVAVDSLVGIEVSELFE
jgi:flagellar motor switch/type III secretory pathway protein FliN